MPTPAMPTPTVSDPMAPAVPWYRQRWPWLLMAGPAIVVVAAMVTLWLAISSDDGVVADDYYKRGLVINRMLEREQRADVLQIGADLAIATDGAVRADVAGSADAALPETLRLRLTHATRAGMDRVAVLQRGADGAYRGRVELPPAGRWLVVLESDDWRLPTIEVAGRPEAVHLGAQLKAQ
jgi:uncharacterized protein